jgi:iron complex outermembrane recepter protein
MIQRSEIASHVWAMSILGTTFSLLMTGGSRAWADTATESVASPPANAVAGNLEEIVVTARKRSEREIDVPTSVTAIAPEALERYASTDLTSIGNMVSQVSIDHSPTGSGALITIRGVTAGANQDASVEQDVTINIDGVPTSRGRILETSMFDMQGIEILKGPQALYYGKNSPAGVVSLNSKDPSDHDEGYARVGYETTAEEYSAEAAISLPITDKLGVRLAFSGDDMHGGYIRNDAGGIPAAQAPLVLKLMGISVPAGHYREAPGDKDANGRLTVVYKPTDFLDFRLKALIGNHQDRGDNSDTVVFSCGGASHTVTTDFADFAPLSDPYGTCRKGKFQNSMGSSPPLVAANFTGSNGGVPYTNVDTEFVSLAVNYQLDKATITFISGFYQYDETSFDYFDNTAFAMIPAVHNDFNTAYTEELRATTSFDSPVNFSGGLFYENDARRFFGPESLGYLGPDPVTGKWQSLVADDTATGESYSGFGDLNWKIRSNLDLTAGARYSLERRAGRVGNTFVSSLIAPFDITSPAGKFVDASLTEHNVSPEATLSWHPSADSTIYAAYKTGFKAGGISNPALIPFTASAQNLEYSLEKAKGFEVGAKFIDKASGLEGDFQIYDYRFTGLQLTAFNAQTTSYFIQNAGSSSIRGAEVNLRWSATPDLSFRGSVGYNRARYQSFPTAECFSEETVAEGCVNGGQNLAGKPLLRAPDWSSDVGADWNHPVGGDWKFGLSTDVRYSSGYFYTIADSPFAYQGGFYILDASAHLHSADGKWEFAVVGKNLADKFYAVTGEDLPLGARGETTASLGRPRTVLLQVTRHFL